jgi:hypothetical protein
MAKKKCKVCLTCFEVFWHESKRYYYCWLCKKWYAGRDDDLQEVPNPRENLNTPIPVESEN